MNRLTVKIADPVKLALVALLGLFVALAAAAPARAEFGIAPGSFKVEVLDENGDVVPQAQAGAHPFVQRVAFDFNTKPDPFIGKGGGPEPIPDENIKDVVVHLPQGLLGTPKAVPRCTTAQFVPPGFGGFAQCPTDSQVGITKLALGFSAGYKLNLKLPIYNLVPPRGVAARIGFTPLLPITVDFRVRSGGDYGLDAIVSNVSQGANFYGSVMELWGIPADPRHDAERYRPGGLLGDANGNPLSSGADVASFVTSPSQCGTPLPGRLEAASWVNPAIWDEAESSPPMLMTGCDSLTFTPSLKAAPDSPVADSTSSFSVALTVPQTENPYGQVQPAVKKTVVTLPEGVALNTSSAVGLIGCSAADIKLGNGQPDTCPPSSKIGHVEVSTPLLDHDLEGGVYMAKQYENPFGSMIAFYLALNDPETGTVLKMPGRVTTDPRTGQITTTFSDTPEVPFEQLEIRFRGGRAAPLKTPEKCGTYVTKAQLTSWAKPQSPVEVESSFEIDEGCDRGSGFHPELDAGSTNPAAGASSPFVVRVLRGEDEQSLSRIDVTLPEGLLARVGELPLCTEAEAATASCPAASQIGAVTVGVGWGPDPVYVPEPGKEPTAIYMAGPFKGAPYSLVIEVPAQAGTFDLGRVVVRTALHVDPRTTRVTAVSDPLPQILEGIPISYRDIRVEVTRPDFMVNPTSCDPMAVDGSFTSIGGTSAGDSDSYQLGNCERLGFKPKLSLRFFGETHRSAHPKLRAVLKARKGDANIERVAVTLPKTEFLDQAHIRTICTRVQYAAEECPRAAIYGYARAWTPLLGEPLRGPVYLRSSDNQLPDLVVDLGGAIDVDLVGRIDSVHQRIRDTFEVVPDAPVSKFVLTMQGGKKGLLVNNAELCDKTPRANIEFTAQNGKVRHTGPVAVADCGKRSH
jgi:hypothetical protein